MELEIIKEKIRVAIGAFNNEKDHLYRVDIFEPTLSHRIALHLESEFFNDGYVVDCEYNRNINDDKNDDLNQKIRPDIIIHRRGSNENNLVIFEVKKAGKDSKKGQEDIRKLRRISNLNYMTRVFVGVLKNKTQIVYVEDNSVEVQEI